MSKEGVSINKALGKFKRMRILNRGSGSCLPRPLFSCPPHSLCSSPLTLFLALSHTKSIPATGTLPGALIPVGSSWFFVLWSQPLPSLDILLST